MSSETLASSQNTLNGNLAGAWDILSGYQGQDYDLGLARRFGGSSVAYSLRDIGANGVAVVRVRRLSDSAEEDFSANQVSSGSLANFCSAPLTVGTAVNGTGSFGNYTLTNVSNSGFSADNSAGGTGSAGFPYTFKNGDVMTVTYTVTNFSSTSGLSPQIRGTTATDNVTSVASGGTVFTANGTYTDTLTASNNGTHLMFADGNTGSYTISNFSVTSHKTDGFVEVFYDQSGNFRHAIQETATNQPKIVSTGVVIEINNKPAITFDGSDNFLEVDGTGSAEAYSFSPSGDFGMFIVSKQSVGNIVDSRDAGGDGIFIQQSSSTTTRFRYNASANNIDVTATNDAQHFNTMTLDGTTLSGSVDGGTAVTKTVTAGVNTTKNLVLGKAFSGNNSNFLDGEIQEAIFYETSVASEKSEIETNIDNFYSIT